MNNRYKQTLPRTTLSVALTLALATAAFADKPYPAGSSSTTSPSSQGKASETFSQSDLDRDGALNRNEFRVLQQSQKPQPPDTTLLSKHVKDLKGVEVQNQGFTKIGKVKELVVSRQDNRLNAVISVGGVLGLGDTELAMPLDQLTWQQDLLIAPMSSSEEQLKQQANYNKTAYQELDGDKIIGEVGGMIHAPDRQMAAQFFDTLDANQDGLIDRAEFSAFETREMPPSSSSTTEPGTVAPEHRSIPGRPYQ